MISWCNGMKPACGPTPAGISSWARKAHLLAIRRAPPSKAAAAITNGSRVDGPWFEEMQKQYTPAIGLATIRAVQDIIDLYFPDGSPSPSLSPMQKAHSGATAL